MLGYLLEDATPKEQTDFLAAIPDPPDSPTDSSENGNIATRPPVSAVRYNPERSTCPDQRSVRIGVVGYAAADRRPIRRRDLMSFDTPTAPAVPASPAGNWWLG